MTVCVLYIFHVVFMQKISIPPLLTGVNGDKGLRIKDSRLEK